MKAINEIKDGLFETKLGSNLYKKRVARKNQGKRGSYRTLIAFKQDDKAIFLYGFAKNERENINNREKETYKKLAGHYLGLTESQLNTLITNHELIEVTI